MSTPQVILLGLVHGSMELVPVTSTSDLMRDGRMCVPVTEIMA